MEVEPSRSGMRYIFGYGPPMGSGKSLAGSRVPCQRFSLRVGPMRCELEMPGWQGMFPRADLGRSTRSFTDYFFMDIAVLAMQVSTRVGPWGFSSVGPVAADFPH